MPVRIILVNDDRAFVRTMGEALRRAGHEVTVFAEPMSALEALNAGAPAEILVTRIGFGEVRQNGLSAALVAKKQYGVKVIFTALDRYRSIAEAAGVFLPLPVEERQLLSAIDPETSLTS